MIYNRNYGELKVAILKMLSCGDELSMQEMLSRLNNDLGMRQITKNNLSTALSQLISLGEPIIRVSAGVYKLQTGKEKRAIELTEYDAVKEACNDLQKCLEKVLTYELSEELFRKYKKIYVANKDYLKRLKILEAE